MPNEERLSAIETQLNNMAHDITHIKNLVDRHDLILFGPRTGELKENPGMIVEVDRLVEHRKEQDKTTFVAYTAAVGLLCKTIWDYITKH